MHIALMHTSFLAVPWVPRNVRAVEISERIEDNCIILVEWDPPASSNGSDIDHYIIYIPSRNIIYNESSTVTVLRVPSCHDDDGLIVAAVNRFGCIGLNSSEIRPNLFFDAIPTTAGGSTTTSIEGGSTSTSFSSKE